MRANGDSRPRIVIAVARRPMNQRLLGLLLVVASLGIGVACKRTASVSNSGSVPAPPPRASVTCNLPNGSQNGDVPFTQLRLRCDSPPPCGGLSGAFGVTLESTFGSRISATLNVTRFDERERPSDSPPLTFEVPGGRAGAPGTSSIVSCSGRLDLSDSQNPRTYSFSHQLVEAKAYHEPPAGGYTCPQIPPKVSQCGVRPVTDGIFEPQSAAYLLAQYDTNNNVWVVPQNSPICIDRRAPAYDRFQQAQCRENAAEVFRIENSDTAGCYMMVDSIERLIHPAVRDSDASELFGSTVQDMFTHGCAAEVDSVHWQLVPLSQNPNGYYLIKNKLTGGCIEALRENNQNRVGTEVSVQRCATSLLQQQWKLKRIR